MRPGKGILPASKKGWTFQTRLGRVRLMKCIQLCVLGVATASLFGTRVAEAQDKAGGSLALPSIQTAGSDERGRITVNGKPFFPILMYDVPTDAESLKMFREHGFNTLTASKRDEIDRLLANGLYAAVHAGHKLE